MILFRGPKSEQFGAYISTLNDNANRCALARERPFETAVYIMTLRSLTA